MICDDCFRRSASYFEAKVSNRRLIVSASAQTWPSHPTTESVQQMLMPIPGDAYFSVPPRQLLQASTSPRQPSAMPHDLAGLPSCQLCLRLLWLAYGNWRRRPSGFKQHALALKAILHARRPAGRPLQKRPAIRDGRQVKGGTAVSDGIATLGQFARWRMHPNSHNGGQSVAKSWLLYP